MEIEYLEQLKAYIITNRKLSSDFGKFSKIYNMTTENIYGFLKNYDLKDKRILSVAGSGDQRLNAYLLGAKEVTCFDINPLTKLHLDLKDSAIANINFEKFLNFFNIYSRKYGSFFGALDFRIYDEFKDSLDSNTRYLFDEIINNSEISEKSIYFDFLNDVRILENMNGYLTPDTYEKMSTIIKKQRINFIESSIDELSSKLNGDKFDMILLSNISDYIHKIYGENGLEEYRKVIDKLTDNLELYGIMQVGYIYANYSKYDDVGNFRISSERNKYFPCNEFYSVVVDSYQEGYKDKVITYQKLK